VWTTNLAELPKVPAELVPHLGAFYPLSQPTVPWPGFVLRELGIEADVYLLGPGQFLVDEAGIVIGETGDLSARSSLHYAGPDGNGPLDPVAAYGCGLWVSISPVATNTNSVLVTIHNSVLNRSYTLWSTTNLSVPLTSWVAETNVLGANGDATPVLIAMTGRPNLFFRASEVREYVVDRIFTNGLAFSDTGRFPPDTMGAVGPNHFVELLNWGGFPAGTNSVAVYDKSGTRLAATNSCDFFRHGTNYPTGPEMADSRVLYDHHAHRWVATGLDYRGTKQVILAVSLSDSPLPLGLGPGWTNFLLDFSGVASFTDFPTLGVDDNGIYVTALQSESDTNRAHTIIAIKKPEIYQWPSILITNRLDIYASNTIPIGTIQPAVNFDTVGTNDYAWFLGKGIPDLGSNYQGGAVYYRRLRWNGASVALAENDWLAITNGASYRDFYDLDGTNVVLIPSVGSRLCSTVIRDRYVWTCQGVGLSGTNGTYTGDKTGAAKDREGIQWLRFRVDPGTSLLNYGGHGRFYDRAASNAFSYSYPSLAVNCAGDMVTGCSGFNSANYVSAFCWTRLASGSDRPDPLLVQPGLTSYVERLGDYSATTLDPADDWAFWTVQEYADPLGDPNGVSTWRTVIARVRPAP
jgi:hypothetical protein